MFVCLFVSITCYKLRRRKLGLELSRFSEFASVAAWHAWMHANLRSKCLDSGRPPSDFRRIFLECHGIIWSCIWDTSPSATKFNIVSKLAINLWWEIAWPKADNLFYKTNIKSFREHCISINIILLYQHIKVWKHNCDTKDQCWALRCISWLCIRNNTVCPDGKWPSE